MIDVLIVTVCIAVPGLAIFFAFRSIWRGRKKEASQHDSGSWSYTSDGGSDSGGD
ncbi:MAG: hypothetical protein LCH38_13120 [Proteobacteria bacterium]|nr:hypothetical protein [Pseudomonadota bacterium]